MSASFPEQQTQAIFERNTVFYVLAPNPWHSQWMNRQQLCSRIGQYCPVNYSTGLPFNWQQGVWSQLLSHPKAKWQHSDNVELLTPSSLQVRIPKLPWLEKTAIRAFSRDFCARKQPEHYKVLYIFHPAYADYIPSIEHDFLLYHPYDNFSKQGTFTQEARSKEQWLMDKADLVITPSQGVSRELSQAYQRQHIETVHNGVDFAAFSAAAGKHTDDRGKKKIAYIGSINVKVDMDALLSLADHFTDANIVLVGPVGEMAHKKASLEQLKSRENVIFTGPKPRHQLPEIAASMDVLLMCYDTSPTLWAEHAYPLKLNEYLAVKKPVVSCPLASVPNADRYFDIASSPQQWIACVDYALQGKSSKVDAGFNYASQQDWSIRVEEIATLIAKYAQ